MHCGQNPPTSGAASPIRSCRTRTVTSLFLLCLLPGLPGASGQSYELPELGKGVEKRITKGAVPGSVSLQGRSTSRDVQVLLRTSAREYKVGEPVFVDFRIYNVGRKPINLYNELAREGWLVVLQLWLIGKDGSSEVIYSSKPVQVAARQKKDSVYVYLPPGGTVGRFYSLQVPGAPFPPGDYELHGAYGNMYQTCLASLSFTDKQIQALGRKAYVGLWTGQIFGQPVPFRITGKLEDGKAGQDKKRGKKSGGLFRRRRGKAQD